MFSIWPSFGFLAGLSSEEDELLLDDEEEDFELPDDFDDPELDEEEDESESLLES